MKRVYGRGWYPPVCFYAVSDAKPHGHYAGTLPDHVQPQGVPPVPERAVHRHAAHVLLGRLVLCGGRHLHPIPHAGACHHHLDRSLPGHHQPMGRSRPDHLRSRHAGTALLRAHTEVREGRVVSVHTIMAPCLALSCASAMHAQGACSICSSADHVFTAVSLEDKTPPEYLVDSIAQKIISIAKLGCLTL